jgi:hypothetical protein
LRESNKYKEWDGDGEYLEFVGGGEGLVEKGIGGARGVVGRSRREEGGSLGSKRSLEVWRLACFLALLLTSCT